MPERATAADVLSHYEERLAGKEALLASVAISVNQEYSPADRRLSPGDEVALLPPVSGGADRDLYVRLLHERIVPHAIVRLGNPIEADREFAPPCHIVRVSIGEGPHDAGRLLVCFESFRRFSTTKGDRAELVEHEGDGAGLAEITAELGEDRAHVGDGPLLVVGKAGDHDRDAAGAVTQRFAFAHNDDSYALAIAGMESKNASAAEHFIIRMRDDYQNRH